ncbi:hypothetical protein LX16_2341 [Stackebrandtia albiflava]|uniref:Integral membrane protein n=1 Tax=Stackebrandtia albiflava TaxID=406432 RepID=A0A562V192_9ACTN|nr:hypothetical protein [Stackebrandtia albiflava]TWJ11615.1 hypothetical protein LX16_2341 [Stackebrandtia albiflava]
MTYPPPQDPHSPQYPQGQYGPGYSPPGQHPASGVPVSPYAQPAYTSPAYPPGYAPAPPVVTERPTVVTAAGIAILVTVALSLFTVALAFTSIPMMNDEDRGIALWVGVVFLITGIGFVALALGVLRGRQGVRITAIVVYALFLMMNICVSFVLGVALSETEGEPWQAVTATVLVFLLCVIDILIIVLLSLTPANRWFSALSAARRAGTLR